MDKKIIYIGGVVVVVLVVTFFLLGNQGSKVVCGDGVCSLAEDITSCPNDCGAASGKIHSVSEYNQLVKSGLAPGNYNVKGYIIYTYYYCPTCPEGAACAPCIYPHLILSDKQTEKAGYSRGGQLDADELYLEPQDTNVMGELELLGQYIMTVDQNNGESRIVSYKKFETTGPGGIAGVILLGPTCPVIRDPPDPQCADKPYAATVVVKTADGSSEVTRFTSNKDGSFRVELAPGTYLLDPLSPEGSILPRGESQTVTVSAGAFTDVTISYDTGIR